MTAPSGTGSTRRTHATSIDRETIGYDCIALILTRRVGDGKVFTIATCLTTLNECEEIWTRFLSFCTGMGASLTHAESALVTDMSKGLDNACASLGINHRSCAKHVHGRIEKNGWFIGKKDVTLAPFFKLVKATNSEESDYALRRLL